MLPVAASRASKLLVGVLARAGRSARRSRDQPAATRLRVLPPSHAAHPSQDGLCLRRGQEQLRSAGQHPAAERAVRRSCGCTPHPSAPSTSSRSTITPHHTAQPHHPSHQRTVRVIASICTLPVNTRTHTQLVTPHPSPSPNLAYTTIPHNPHHPHPSTTPTPAAPTHHILNHHHHITSSLHTSLPSLTPSHHHHPTYLTYSTILHLNLLLSATTYFNKQPSSLSPRPLQP